MRLGGAVLGVVLACALSLGCGRGEARTPEEVVTAFVGAMEQSRGDPRARQRAFGMLSERARASLTERAQRASQVSDREFQPWEMLAPGRWRARIQFDPEALTSRVDGTRAVVTARGRTGGAADVPLVREGGVWRVDLELPPMPALRASGADGGR